MTSQRALLQEAPKLAAAERPRDQPPGRSIPPSARKEKYVQTAGPLVTNQLALLQETQNSLQRRKPGSIPPVCCHCSPGHSAI